MAANEAASESETAWEKVPKSETEASKREASEAEARVKTLFTAWHVQ